jgi:uncharacterized protein YndB with AHSA1/START domain
MNHTKTAYSETQMLIRKTVDVVFEAFIDPAITSKFWFTKGSSKLEVGKTLTWEWEMYSVSATVIVKEIIPNKKIVIDWGNPITSVDFNFNSLSDGTTYVTIKHYGSQLDNDALIAAIKDSTAGFTTVLNGLKAYLEQNLNLNLIADKFPKEIAKHVN